MEYSLDQVKKMMIKKVNPKYLHEYVSENISKKMVPIT